MLRATVKSKWDGPTVTMMSARDALKVVRVNFVGILGGRFCLRSGTERVSLGFQESDSGVFEISGIASWSWTNGAGNTGWTGKTG